MEKLPRHDLRPATPDDRGYIIDSWLQSFRGSPFAQRLPSDVYWSRYGQAGLVEDLVGQASLVVACLPDDPTYIYGWLCAQRGGCLHYVFVRHDFRRMGFASRLVGVVEPEIVTVTHMTTEFSRLMKGREVKYTNPYRPQRKD